MALIVATPLPDVDLQPHSVITVTLDKAGAKITSLVVHGWQGDTGADAGQTPLLVYGDPPV